MRNFKKETAIKCMVSYKLYGYFGKTLTPFTKKERAKIIDYMIEQNWITTDMQITKDGDALVRQNLGLLNSYFKV